MNQLFLLYIDPGSGSLLLQVLIGGIVAGSLFFKRFFIRLFSVFKRKDKDQDDI